MIRSKKRNLRNLMQMKISIKRILSRPILSNKLTNRKLWEEKIKMTNKKSQKMKIFSILATQKWSFSSRELAKFWSKILPLPRLITTKNPFLEAVNAQISTSMAKGTIRRMNLHTKVSLYSSKCAISNLKTWLRDPVFRTDNPQTSPTTWRWPLRCRDQLRQILKYYSFRAWWAIWRNSNGPKTRLKRQICRKRAWRSSRRQSWLCCGNWDRMGLRFK